MVETPWRRVWSELPPSLRGLIEAELGPLLAPLRAEIFGPQRFAEHGRSLGLTHEARRPGWAGARFFPRLDSNIRMLRQAHDALAAQLAEGGEVGPASLWLLDNFHLVEAQMLAIDEGLPRSYFRSLPVLQSEALADLPRIYGVAWAYVAHTDSAFDVELLRHYLGAYQETRPLRLSELWALPTTLRVVLLENLRRLAERLATHQAARAVANLCCDQIADGQLPELDAILARVAQRGAATAFLAQMGQRLLDRTSGADERVPERVRTWLQGVLPNFAAVQSQQAAEQTADNLSVSNAVSALRAISDADWSALVESSSSVIQRLSGDPLFVAEHQSTRDQTVHGIEALARRSGRSELQVAECLLVLMKQQPAGHWLRGKGRAELNASLGMVHRAGWLSPRHAPRRVVLLAYLVAVGLGTWAAVSLLLPAGARAWAAWPAIFLMLWPVGEAVIGLLNRLISESTRPQPLPRLALGQGIPAEHRVMVVIPAMLSSTATIDACAHRLHLHHLANPEAEAQFALLTDWADADTEDTPNDAALLAHAVGCIAALNGRLQKPLAPHSLFLLLHRPRRYSESERRWIGWERKRGKLEQLVALLVAPAAPAVHAPPAFVELGPLSTPAPGTRYIVTLDSDTELPPGRLRELVGVAAHPSNRPQLSADGRRVEAGYGILQPRLVTPLPQPAEDTVFHRLFAGQCGIDPYSVASSEVYQDLFHEGSFTGKGLLDVQAVHSVLGGHLPEGLVLSHDLLEGALARCAAVTDVNLVEDAPFHAEVAASRVHRWTRGDWQLLPILLQSVWQPGRFPLGAVNRWKMADNLRRSLVPPASLALLVLGLAGMPALPMQLAMPMLIAVVLAAFAIGPLMGALTGLVSSRRSVALQHFYRAGGLDLLRALAGGVWHLVMLLQHALLAVDAIGRALYRTLVSHHLLLQWTTAEAAQAAASNDLPTALRRHWSVPLVALLLAFALWALDTPHPGWTLLLCGLWAAAPLWSWAASRPGFMAASRVCPPEDAVALLAIARDTWRYFERCVTAADHHLPPDNLQSQPHEMLAHRTSPTNIGIYLLAAACARQFGWIDTPELLQRLQSTLDTLDKLPRHRGHFFNWYDTRHCEALLPMYVSTVDSGNLSGHLLAVAQACLELAREPLREPPDGARVQALREVARRCEALAWAADFRLLYHPRRHLLHIGYRVAEQQLDAGFYDLLASEARLTSLLAIAKGDVPVRHWAALGRPFYAVGSIAGLRSWSGSMFEYLMPTLVLAEPQGSVLHDACRAALVEQWAFAAEQGVPWGISESAHSGADHTLAYQYSPQGVPHLALRRTPADELVIAPYATALAAQLAPHRAAQNYAALQQLGARGELGFIEALDYTPSRQIAGPSAGKPMTLVHTSMAHHQGMTLVALANVLLGGVAQRWGMAIPQVQAVASLLHERAPREVSLLHALSPEPFAPARRLAAPSLWRHVRPGQHAIEPTHLLSNGRYSVALRANGAGRSRWGDSDITRSRDDALRDQYGSFFWLRKSPRAALVSLTQHPAPDPEADYQSSFHADRVSFHTDWPGLKAQVTVWVSPEDDIEFRQVELVNRGREKLTIELISALEPTLTDPRADEAHPSFGQLFIEARADVAQQALCFERRPRLATENGLHMAHFIAEGGELVNNLRFQVDRQHWLGRNRAAWQPQAGLDQWGSGGGEQGLTTGLDPVCVLAASLSIAPGARVRLCFATAASRNSATLQAVIDKYREPRHIARALLMSATLAGISLRAWHMGADTYTTLQSLTTALMMTLTRPPSSQLTSAAAVPAAVAAACDRRLLWRFGISGDRPLVLVSVTNVAGLGLVRSLSHALRLWSWGGVPCDLVVVNAEPASYEMALQRELTALRDRYLADSGALTPSGGAVAPDSRAAGGWHLLATEALSADELSTLQGVARVRLLADGRSLAWHLNQWADLHEVAMQQRQEGSLVVLAPAHPHSLGAAAWRTPVQNPEVPAPTGAFADAGSDGPQAAFTFEVSARQRPQRPWINVLANAGFGCHLSEAGGGYTWAGNSRMNQLTPWSNDPVADPPAEWLLLQDLRSRQTWSLQPTAWAAAGAAYQVTHAPGHSHITHVHDGLELSVSWCVDPFASVKQVAVRIVNRGSRARQLRLVSACEWMLGAQRSDRAGVLTAVHLARVTRGRLTALLATQAERSGGLGGGTAFVAAVQPEPQGQVDWTCDRRELFDSRGRPVLPDQLAQTQGNGLDPCAVLSMGVSLDAGASCEREFLMGWANSPQAARQLAIDAAEFTPVRRLQAVNAHWEGLLGATQVRTPDPLFDAMVNRWLLYQTVVCRLWAKAGFYQAGGATGFRDQLQDAMALSWAAPQMLREQILRCAAHQFVEGDVLHWWHDPQGAGVRTHFSDDLLWLPHAVLHHLSRTGDTELLDEQQLFIEGQVIPEGAEDSYGTSTVTPTQASIYEHAARAIDRSLRVGVHGLPLMGSGDWNDGMNRVGHQGRGESVWMGWFLCHLVAGFAPLARSRGEAQRATRWEEASAGWQQALQGPAWDGAWYRRAFFDDGQTLGSAQDSEARIDLIAQAWAVLSGAAPADRQARAMAAVNDELVDHSAGLLRLLTPPLQHQVPSAGYIQAYPPGVRENGGQYSHAGVWAVMAQIAWAQHASHSAPAKQAALDRAWEWFKHLNPAHRSVHPGQAAAYGAEPYVMAGDVCSAAPYTGRAGWSWYTGSAGWMHRTAIESIFGLDLGPRWLSLKPGLPSHWPQAELALRRDGRHLRVLLLRCEPDSALARAGPWLQGHSAQLLAPGEQLDWTALGPQAWVVVPLSA